MIVRLFITTLCLVIFFIFPAYAVPSNTTIQNSIVNTTIQNSSLVDKLLNIELKVNSCQTNITENCQVVSSKLNDFGNKLSQIDTKINNNSFDSAKFAYYGLVATVAAVLMGFILQKYLKTELRNTLIEIALSKMQGYFLIQKNMIMKKNPMNTFLNTIKMIFLL